jgi:hypothetical protein
MNNRKWQNTTITLSILESSQMVWIRDLTVSQCTQILMIRAKFSTTLYLILTNTLSGKLTGYFSNWNYRGYSKRNTRKVINFLMATRLTIFDHSINKHYSVKIETNNAKHTWIKPLRFTWKFKKNTNVFLTHTISDTL